MSLPNLRLAAARLHVPRRARLQALEELFARTAAAFGSPVPPPRGRGPTARLAEYARFTRERAEEALARSEGGGDPAALAALERRLYRAARGLGGRFRLQLGVRSPERGAGRSAGHLPGAGHRFPGLSATGRSSSAAARSPPSIPLASARWSRRWTGGCWPAWQAAGSCASSSASPKGRAAAGLISRQNGARPDRPRAIVVGSGAGGAAAARELQGTYQVTILEAGREFRPLGLSLRWMERLRNWGLLVDERLIRLVFPAMRVRRSAEGLVHVNGAGTGGTTTLSAGNALRMDGPLRELGIDLDREFEELAREVPVSTAHRRNWSEPTRRLFELCERGRVWPRAPRPR